jgi:transcriptional regulator with XRE-family HTH domain
LGVGIVEYEHKPNRGGTIVQRNSIGRFIAVLRKANGMTQQEMADRLNVSNKAVSRWERDECSPDLTLIPAIAEMFGVSCDELLRGERLTGSLDSEPLITHTYPLQRIDEAYELFEHKLDGVIKVAVEC